ncbi:MAG: phosphotransferase [Candidatus Hydrogenedens sp.]|nr:phosphotransferase [Candidatus Hydrogenedens sp.]
MGMKESVAAAMGASVVSTRPLEGGCIGEVYHATLDDGQEVVVKWHAGPGGTLDTEGQMLRYLDEHAGLPVPVVFHTEPGLLIMSFEPGSSTFSTAAQQHAAVALAALHAVAAPKYGFKRATLIGGLHQPNDWSKKWVPFFREQRLLYMAEEAAQAGRLPASTRARIDQLAEKLPDLIGEPDKPALLHGDVWTTNVLAQGGKVTAFLDPAIYYGHPEIELAFITLFNTFGDAFFTRYQEIRAIAPGFFEERRDLYNLYPLLVHVRLFGGGYVHSVEQTLSRFGC